MYALTAAALGFLAMEGVARLLEPHLFPSWRTLPVAAPAALGREVLEEKLRMLGGEASGGKRPSGDLPVVAMVEDPFRGWALPAHGVSDLGGPDTPMVTNSFGLRGPEPGVLEPGEVRIFTLGDSSIYGEGVGYEEVFSTRAAEDLSARWGRKVSAVNGGVPGYDAGQSLTTLRLFGSILRPTWVIIGSFWSDVYRQDGVHDIREELAYLPPMRQRFRFSSLYRLVWRTMDPWLRVTRVRYIESKADVGAAPDGSGSRMPLGAWLQNLETIARESMAMGARVAFLMPVAPMDFDQVPPPSTVQEYRIGMRRLAERLDAPLVDGPRYFKEAGAGITFFRDQCHPNALGHGLLADALVESLVEAGPPPAGTSRYP